MQLSVKSSLIFFIGSTSIQVLFQFLVFSVSTQMWCFKMCSLERTVKIIPSIYKVIAAVYLLLDRTLYYLKIHKSQRSVKLY